MVIRNGAGAQGLRGMLGVIVGLGTVIVAAKNVYSNTKDSFLGEFAPPARHHGVPIKYIYHE